MATPPRSTVRLVAVVEYAVPKTAFQGLVAEGRTLRLYFPGRVVRAKVVHKVVGARRTTPNIFDTRKS